MFKLFFTRNLATLSSLSHFPAYFRLKTGHSFQGISFGAPITRPVFGETVFTTSLVAYPESMTDPSYHNQILVFTQPLVGNYGVPAPEFDKFGLLSNFESDKIHVKGIIVNDYAIKYSHWKAVESLGNWCTRFKVPAISGIDTRAIVNILRDNGTCIGEISAAKDDQNLQKVQLMNHNLVADVSHSDRVVYNSSGKYKIALIDCGAKQNIIRFLCELGAQVHLLPWDFDVKKEMDLKGNIYDGIFISNGPGDPRFVLKTVENLKKLIKPEANKPVVPIFGICMGNLLLGMAAGFKVKKLPYGNRGHNQPVINLKNEKCLITSQNHGYALVDDSNVPSGWKTFFKNANDGSNEGICHESLPFSSVQFHPEAKGGPLDTKFLFDEFMKQVVDYHNKKI